MLSPLSENAANFINEYYWLEEEVLEKYPEAVDELVARNFLERRRYQTINSYLDKGIPYLSRLWNEYDPRAWRNDIVGVLGFGLWGVAYELQDGSVLKLTTSAAEFWCVEFVVKERIRSIHLPEIYDFGKLDGSRLPMFYYIREALDDAPIGLYQEQLIPVTKTLLRMGIDASGDAHLNNWGVRPDDPSTLVLRDIACTVKNRRKWWQKLQEFLDDL